ncbi:MAG: hypothetical protein ACREE3_08350, partial [Stellaceae bacterium]
MGSHRIAAPSPTLARATGKESDGARLRGWGPFLVRMLVLALASLFLFGTVPALAASPAAYCRRVGTDDATRPIPRSLVPAATRLFHLHHMPREAVMRSTLY